MQTKKKKRNPRGSATRNFDSVLWTVPMCAAWSGFAPDYIRSQIRAGVIEALLVGPGYDRPMPSGVMCRRSCAKFLVIAESFKAFVEGLTKLGRVSVGPLRRLPGEAA